MSGRKSVLVPMGRGPRSYVCMRSPSERGLRTIAASEYGSVPTSVSRFCDETVVVPSPEDDLLAYRDGLLEIAARPEVGTILPTRPRDAYLFTYYEDAFEEHASVVTPSPGTMRTVHDRVRLAAAAEDAGVPVPDTQLLSDASTANRPRIVKSRYNLLASRYDDSYTERESSIAKSVTHLEAGERPDVEALTESMGHEPIVQEYVPSSDEYLFGALYDHGEPVATFQHRQVRGDSYTGGGGVYRESTAIPELERVGRQLLESLDYHGLACIEYMKHAETGEFYLTEINPRLWQSIPSAVRAGADFPSYYCLLAEGRADEIDPDYEVGVGTHQLYGETCHFVSLFTDSSPVVERPSIAKTAWEILSSCCVEPRFDVFRPDDPRPFLRSVGYLLRKNKTAILGDEQVDADADAVTNRGLTDT